jgi:transposase-like protein
MHDDYGARRGYSHTCFLDEVFVKIQRKQQYLWRAVNQDSEVVDVLLQPGRDGKAAKRFFTRLLKRHGDEPRKIVTDKSRSYGAALRELIPQAIHDTSQYANNRVSFRINRFEFESRICVVSNQACRRSDFSMCIRLHTIFSTLADP